MDTIVSPPNLAPTRIGEIIKNDNKIVELKKLLNEVHQYFEFLFDQNTNGQTLVSNYTNAIDSIIIGIWQNIDVPKDATLIASGGYGRKELYPHSDIDLIIVLADDAADDLTPVEEFLQILWDCRFDVGQSVLKVSEFAQSMETIESYTSFNEHRYLTGSKSRYTEFSNTLSEFNSWDETAFFEQKVNEQNRRHDSYKNTIYNLEPNIKEAPGGLRDIHMILWLSQRIHKTRDLKKLVALNVLTQEEANLLQKSHNFLKLLRFGLHLVAKRKEDRLIFDHQNALASKLGYLDRKNVLAVEQLMRRYYQCAMTIVMLNSIVIQELRDDLLYADGEFVKLNDDFTLYERNIGITSDEVFDKNSSNLFALFKKIAENPDIKGIRPRAVRAIRAYIKNINKEFREDPQNKEAFLELFKHPKGLFTALRELNSSGVLARFIPAFSQIVGRMQYDLFHAYTVDAHTFFVIRNLCDFINGDDHGMEELVDVANQVSRPELLLLSALFHDIAKGRGGDHSIKGAKDARQFGKSFGLSHSDASLIEWLVLHHLDMSTTAQRKDITDPEIVGQFASTVGDQYHLDLLYLLTVADIRATSPTLWNGWKRQLLFDLYQATKRELKLSIESNLAHPNRLQSSKNDALKLIKSDTPSVEALWNVLSEDYFTRTDIATVAWHADSIIKASANDIPLIKIRPHNNANIYQIMVYAPDVAIQLPLVTSALTLQNLNIVDARIFRLKNNMILMNFIILDQDGSHLSDKKAHPKLLIRLQNHIIKGQLPEKFGALLSHYKHKFFEAPTKVNIINSSGANPVTIIELDTLDQTGLLYRVFKTLHDLRLRLLGARILTLGERVEDVFFVTDRDGEIIEDEEQIATIKKGLIDALSTPLDKI